MMLAVATFAAMLAGFGLYAIGRGAMAVPPPLNQLVADLHRVRQTDVDGRGKRTDWLHPLIWMGMSGRDSDLAILERDEDELLKARLTWAAIGASCGLLSIVVQQMGVMTWLGLPAGLLLTLFGAAAGWMYAPYDLKSDAVKARQEFLHSLASYLELVSILMAGGAGVETALFEAAQIGTGRGYRHIRTALITAQVRQDTPWSAFGELGQRLEIPELEHLEASMTLAGGGAQVKQTLATKASTMRETDLARTETEANRRSETMVLPVAMMFAGFLLLLGYPALAGLNP